MVNLILVAILCTILRAETVTDAATSAQNNGFGSSILGPELSKAVKTNIDALVDLNPKDYPLKIESIRDEIIQFIERKTRVCNGDFSPTALEVIPSMAAKKVIRLTRDERLLCIKELRAVQVLYINNAYLARKTYLEFLHQSRLQELQQTRDEMLKNLNETLSKIR